MRTSTPDATSDRTYRLTGMHCASCVQRVTALVQDAGFAESTVGLQAPQLRLRGAGDVTGVLNRLAAAGYVAEPFGNPAASAAGDSEAPSAGYGPLIAVVGLATVCGLLFTLFPPAPSVWGTWDGAMAKGMAFFFLFAGLLKAIDLRAFISGFRRYDPLARRVPAYAAVYPGLEWAAAAGYLWMPHNLVLNVLVAGWMGWNTAVAYRTWKQPGSVQCACLGGVLRVPVGPVTTIEYGAMALMAALMAVL